LSLSRPARLSLDERRQSPTPTRHDYDVDYLLVLQAEADVAPFLSAGRADTREELLAEVERSLAEPEAFGRFLIEIPLEQEWRVAGAIGFECVNRAAALRTSRGWPAHPDFRGRGLGAAAIRELARLLFGELGYHRLEAGVYGFNERGLAVSIAPASCVRASSAAPTVLTASGWTQWSSGSWSRISKWTRRIQTWS